MWRSSLRTDRRGAGPLGKGRWGSRRAPGGAPPGTPGARDHLAARLPSRAPSSSPEAGACTSLHCCPSRAQQTGIRHPVAVTRQGRGTGRLGAPNFRRWSESHRGAAGRPRKHQKESDRCCSSKLALGKRAGPAARARSLSSSRGCRGQVPRCAPLRAQAAASNTPGLRTEAPLSLLHRGSTGLEPLRTQKGPFHPRGLLLVLLTLAGIHLVGCELLSLPSLSFE